MRRWHDNDDRECEVNMTPLIDVSLVLVVMLLLATPLAISEAALHAKFHWNWVIYKDWAMFTWYLLLFVLGYMICSDARFWQAIERDGPIALVCAVIAVAIGQYMWIAEVEVLPRPEVVGSVEVPLDTDGGSGQNGQAGSFLIAPGRGKDAPKAHPGERPEVTGPEVLLSHH